MYIFSGKNNLYFQNFSHSILYLLLLTHIDIIEYNHSKRNSSWLCSALILLMANLGNDQAAS